MVLSRTLKIAFLKQILLFFKNSSPLDVIQVTLLFVFRQTHAALDFRVYSRFQFSLFYVAVSFIGLMVHCFKFMFSAQCCVFRRGTAWDQLFVKWQNICSWSTISTCVTDGRTVITRGTVCYVWDGLYRATLALLLLTSLIKWGNCMIQFCGIRKKTWLHFMHVYVLVRELGLRIVYFSNPMSTIWGDGSQLNCFLRTHFCVQS